MIKLDSTQQLTGKECRPFLGQYTAPDWIQLKLTTFFDFISRPCFLQDVAYGTRKLKLDSGEQITIPNSIRTVIPSRIVKQYLAFCTESGFKPVGERTLFRILEVCQASQEKSLQGLDYVSTEGSEMFDVLEEAVETLEQNE